MPSGVPLTIQEVRALARAKGGKFLPRFYRSAKIRYRWRCANGHRWMATVDTIRNRGSWCPYCAKGSGEECVRICFERIFRRKFPKVWLDWMLSDSGRSLELDGFNAGMGVAFEHQGQHHYHHRGLFYRKAGQFQRRLALDKRKHRLCRQRGIRLVKIPEVGWRFSLEELLPEVIRRCRRLGIRVPAGADRRRINYAPAWNMNRDRAIKAIMDLKASARKRGGICLDSEWRGSRARYRFRCRRGHGWSGFPAGVVRGAAWCIRCRSINMINRKREWWATRAGDVLRGKMRGAGEESLVKIHRLARQKGGECLTQEWRGWQSRYRFRCGRCGREWFNYPQNFLDKSQWCRSCSLRKRHAENRKKRDYFGEVRRFVEKKGGKCLDRSWKGWAHKYRLRCGKCAWEWKAPGSSLLSQGNWCKPCAVRAVWKQRKAKAKRRSPAPA
jgi:hypothetical protein